MDILIGTKNLYKATEMVSLINANLKINIHYLKDKNIKIKIEEDQPSLIKNAEKKAVEISKLTDYYVLTSDGGVDIPGLGKRWDILKNQRIVGENNTDIVKADNLLRLMKDLNGTKRKVEYYLALALAKNGKLIWSAQDIYDKGYIVENLPDRNIPTYLWMSHLWYYPKYKRVFNKLTKQEKEEVRKQGIGLKRRLLKIIKSLQLHTRRVI
ncbi:MAG: hypothetical protein US75_C0012G0019 [Candidatus Woesebacteria bacterium GW2011_GWC1_38_13]|uniref:Non-canonical purine NTP pyrophosphatase n=3 Tax=Candidatus Woeseibacteriota TaxID=1752722 RepID=A0A0G0KW05_9BACT|nr:MAG: hypothetical protein US75_C0012G0019 [Candidatus Woesebacteria bacterium GW2011_GWC1_38_13]KKQ83007.1 MAG: hypothetical protein UT06_C0030G0011 [Candidatus Woesebacteria bacterium GW2011_GWA1_38_8]